MNRLLLFLILTVAVAEAWGQDNCTLASPQDSVGNSYGVAAWGAEYVTATGYLDRLPFWSTANRRGLMPQASGGSIIAGGSFVYDTRHVWTFRAGINLAGNVSAASQAMIIDRLYAGADYGKFHLDLGVTDRADNTLSDLSVTGGNMIWTGNARNMVGWNFHTDYINIYKWVSLKGNFADYLMNDNRFVKNTLLHNQSLHLRVALNQAVNISVGLEMWCQWGGDSPVYGRNDVSLGNYFRVVFAKQGNENASASDRINALGNHLGRENLRVEWNADRFRFIFNYDKPYEDGSGTRLQNLPDGVYSAFFSFKDRKRIVTDVLGEFVTTMWQSGPLHDRPAEPGETSPSWLPGRVVLGGNDNYFNNGEYRSGWTFHGQGIGLPLLTLKEPDENGIVYGIVNNRVIGFNIGIAGNATETIPYKLKITYTKNYGRYGNVWNPALSQWSIAAESVVPRFWDFPVEISYGIYGDFGKLYPNSVGLVIRVQYSSSHLIEFAR